MASNRNERNFQGKFDGVYTIFSDEYFEDHGPNEKIPCGSCGNISFCSDGLTTTSGLIAKNRNFCLEKGCVLTIRLTSGEKIIAVDFQEDITGKIEVDNIDNAEKSEYSNEYVVFDLKKGWDSVTFRAKETFKFEDLVIYY